MFSVKTWAGLANKLIRLIKKYTEPAIASMPGNQHSNLIKRMHKELATEEEKIISSFEKQSKAIIS